MSDSISEPKLSVKPFFHPPSSTFSYVAYDPSTLHACIIDPALDYDLQTGVITTEFADSLIDYSKRHNLKLSLILETHTHADHLTASQYIKEVLGGQIGVSSKVLVTQEVVGEGYGMDIKKDGSQFDVLLQDEDVIRIGTIKGRVIYTPGHTVDSVSFYIGDAVFVGDTIFKEDVGTARCDFPHGSAEELFHSIQKLYRLPANTRMYLCHDYPPASRKEQCLTSVEQQKLNNMHIKGDTLLEQFIEIRKKRDALMTPPKYLLPSIQFNVQGIRANRHRPFLAKQPVARSFHIYSRVARNILSRILNMQAYPVKLDRPAKKQIKDLPTNTQAATSTSYNIWYHRFLSTDRDFSLTRALTRCKPEQQSGYTKAQDGAYFCIHFARGCCAKGHECPYIHRVPLLQDSCETTKDVFGRDKHRDDRDDMGGVGSFNRDQKTLYVGRIHNGSLTEDCVVKHFSEFGDIQSIKLLRGKNVAFVTFYSRLQAEFAKEAMYCQAFDNNEILNVRWATDDPNPTVQQNMKRKAEDELESAVLTKMPWLADAEFTSENYYEQGGEGAVVPSEGTGDYSTWNEDYVNDPNYYYWYYQQYGYAYPTAEEGMSHPPTESAESAQDSSLEKRKPPPPPPRTKNSDDPKKSDSPTATTEKRVPPPPPPKASIPSSSSSTKPVPLEENTQGSQLSMLQNYSSESEEDE